MPRWWKAVRKRNSPVSLLGWPWHANAAFLGGHGCAVAEHTEEGRKLSLGALAEKIKIKTKTNKIKGINF